MIGELVRYRSFIKNLVLKDLKLKYRGSVLGFVWSLLYPVMMITVYTFAFRYVLRVEIEHYPYFLLIGLLPWNFFATSAHASTGVIIANASLIKKVYFPRETLPIASVLFSFAQLVLALAVFLPALVLVSGVPLHWTALLFVPLLGLHLLFTVGVAHLLSAVTTSFRDVAHFTEIGLLLLFWVTPIIYPITMVPADLQVYVKLNPAAAFTIAYQSVLFWGTLPEPAVLATVLGWTLAMLLVGQAVFQAYSTSFAEEV
ncbi:MAG TPA: ABC transporter permease [Methylomirabilota bacterium]|jgi:ABC-2 type transport system permease protein|nr:ABC transporter permease [Methylomirabilota bacterium]